MAKVTVDNSTGVKIATFELETPEAYTQFQKGLDRGMTQWSQHPETNELLKYRSENNQNARIYVKYGDVHKQVK